MAYSINQFDGQKYGTDANYPDGDIKDDTGSNNGTKNNRKANADIHQFFRKLMRIAGIAANGSPDNEYNGHQFYQALLLAAVPYKSYNAIITQSGTNDPVAAIMPGNGIGNIIFTRSNTGLYVGTLAGAFTTGKFQWHCQGAVVGAIVNGFVVISPININSFNIITYDFAGNKADGIITGSAGISIELRVFR